MKEKRVKNIRSVSTYLINTVISSHTNELL